MTYEKLIYHNCDPARPTGEDEHVTLRWKCLGCGAMWHWKAPYAYPTTEFYGFLHLRSRQVTEREDGCWYTNDHEARAQWKAAE